MSRYDLYVAAIFFIAALGLLPLFVATVAVVLLFRHNIHNDGP